MKAQITTNKITVFSIGAGKDGLATLQFENTTNVEVSKDTLSFTYVSASTGETENANFRLANISGYSTTQGVEATAQATPIVETPAVPVVETPIVETPVVPVVETPIVETPVVPLVETPIVETPVVPLVETPIVETPVVPVVETPVAPVAPVVETPIVDVQPVIQETQAIVNEATATFTDFQGAVTPAATAEQAAAEFNLEVSTAQPAPVVPTPAATPAAPVVETPTAPAAVSTDFNLDLFN